VTKKKKGFRICSITIQVPLPELRAKLGLLEADFLTEPKPPEINADKPNTQREKVASRPPAKNDPNSSETKAERHGGPAPPRASALNHGTGMCRWGSFNACLEYQRSIGWPKAASFCAKKCG
jgi:hypothetical protein